METELRHQLNPGGIHGPDAASLLALADQLEVRLARARGQVDALTPSLLARAWTHSLPTRSGCTLSLREILFTRSQRVQIAGQLVPQHPTDEPAEKLLERIRKEEPRMARMTKMR